MIHLENVSKWYDSFQVLDNCSTSVSKGEVVVVCGPSGSGKSTLIKAVNGLEPVQKGQITVDGMIVSDKKTNLNHLRARIGMVFQNFELFPHMSVLENVKLGQIKVLGRLMANLKLRQEPYLIELAWLIMLTNSPVNYLVASSKELL